MENHFLESVGKKIGCVTSFSLADERLLSECVSVARLMARPTSCIDNIIMRCRTSPCIPPGALSSLIDFPRDEAASAGNGEC